MARLSEEHFKNTSTPTRKSSRFKDMFRHRPSSSSSSASPNVLTKSSPIPSPLESPTIKLGFEKVGLLPSERESLEAAKTELENNGGMAVSEAIEKQVHELKGVSVPHSLDTGLDISGTTHADEAAKIKEEEKHAREEHVVRQSFRKTLAKHQNEHAEPDIDIATGSSSLKLDPANTNAMLAEDKQRKFALVGPDSQSIDALIHSTDDTTINSADDGDHGKPSVSNIFDDKDSLSQGIREYVSSKIAEMLAEHERKPIYPHPKTISAPVHFTINLDMSALAKVPRSDTGKFGASRPFVLDGPKTIGPFTISHPRIAGDFQVSVIGIYATFVIGSAFVGPKNFLLTLWRLGIVLAGYAYVRGQLGWKDDVHSDMILGPVCYIGREMQYFGGEAAKNFGAVLMSAIVEMFQGVAKDIEVTSNKK